MSFAELTDDPFTGIHIALFYLLSTWALVYCLHHFTFPSTWVLTLYIARSLDTRACGGLAQAHSRFRSVSSNCVMLSLSLTSSHFTCRTIVWRWPVPLALDYSLCQKGERSSDLSGSSQCEPQPRPAAAQLHWCWSDSARRQGWELELARHTHHFLASSS